MSATPGIDGSIQARAIQVGTDLSQTASRAVGWANDFAQRFGAELHLVQVIVPGNPSDTEFGAAERTQAAAAGEALVAEAERLAGTRGRAHVVVDEDPAMAIVGAADDARIDVLVVGNAGMAGRKEFLLGNAELDQPQRPLHRSSSTRPTGSRRRCRGVRRRRAARRSPDPRDPTAPDRAGSEDRDGLREARLKELFGRPDEEAPPGARSAKRREALEELGPTFCKLGQILSPVRTCSRRSSSPSSCSSRARAAAVRGAGRPGVMEQELGVPWEDVFDHVDPAARRRHDRPGPLGGMADGAKVVIKVQRPDARELIEQDLALFGGVRGQSRRPAGSQAGHRPAGRVRAPVDVVAPRARLPQRGAQHGADARGDRAVRPARRAVDPLGVLDGSPVGDGDVGGGPITIAPEGPIREAAAKQLLESFYKQVMVDGFFHADPHPGNLMWQPEEDKLYFLDLGMAGEVGPELRESMMLLLMAFWQDDVGFLTDVTLMMAGAIDRSDLDVEAFQARSAPWSRSTRAPRSRKSSSGRCCRR